MKPVYLLGAFVLLLSGCFHITEQKKISVYFTTTKNNANMIDCGKVAKVERVVDNVSDLGQIYLDELLQGPTIEEREAGFVPHILTNKDLIWRTFVQRDNIVYINWPDFRQVIPNATTSCGSQAFLAPIEKTMQELPRADYVVHAINGDPRAFYEWMQLSCPEYSNDCDKTPFLDTISVQ